MALDTPDNLKRRVGGDLVTIGVEDTAAATTEVKSRYGFDASARDGTVRFHVPQGDRFLPEFVRSFPLPLQSISLQRPTLDDVFITLTGREIRDSELDSMDQLREHGQQRMRMRLRG